MCADDRISEFLIIDPVGLLPAGFVFCISVQQICWGCCNGIVFFLRCVERNGYMIITDAQKPFTAAEPCDLTDFFLGEIQDVLNQPRLLFLHLHDDLDAAGIQNPFAVFAVIQREKVLHARCGCDGDMEGATCS